MKLLLIKRIYKQCCLCMYSFIFINKKKNKKYFIDNCYLYFNYYIIAFVCIRCNTVTWAVVSPADNSTGLDNLFLSAAAKSPTEAVVTGVLAQSYTVDGSTFGTSKNDYLTPSQDVSVTGGGLYAAVGSGLKYNGLSTSKTGEKWTNYDLGVNATLWPARYGAFPSENAYFITAGNFPTAGSSSGH